MRRAGRWLVAAVAIIAGGPAAMALDLCLPRTREPVTVARVVTGDEVLLADGRTVRLAGVAVPRPLDRPDPGREAAARSALDDLVRGRSLAFVALAEPDRHGRLRGGLVDDKASLWLTEPLVAAGHLRVTPRRDERTCVRQLYLVEQPARKAGLGLWSAPEFAVRAAEDTELPKRADSYAIVEGVVVSTGRAGRRRYIDFGRDYRSDFTIVVDEKDVAAFTKAGFGPDGMKGKRLRVRGWLMAHNGTEMVLEVPEGLEWPSGDR